MANACTGTLAGALHRYVGSEGSGSSEVLKISSPRFAYALSSQLPSTIFVGGVTVKCTRRSPVPENSTASVCGAFQPDGTSTPTVTFDGVCANERTRANTSNCFGSRVCTTTYCSGSTVSAIGGTKRSGYANTAVVVEWRLVTGAEK